MGDVLGVSTEGTFDIAEVGNVQATEARSEDIIQFAYEGSIYRGDKKIELNIAANFVRVMKDDAKG